MEETLVLTRYFESIRVKVHIGVGVDVVGGVAIVSRQVKVGQSHLLWSKSIFGSDLHIGRN